MKKKGTVRKVAPKDSLKALVRKYSIPAFAIVAGIPIFVFMVLAVSFSSHSAVDPLLAWGFICDSLAAGIALYVSLLGASRRWYIAAIEFFMFGMFFKLFALL